MAEKIKETVDPKTTTEALAARELVAEIKRLKAENERLKKELASMRERRKRRR
jgi:hypothetical protein